MPSVVRRKRRKKKKSLYEEFVPFHRDKKFYLMIAKDRVTPLPTYL